jgi:hypothetical protein
LPRPGPPDKQRQTNTTLADQVIDARQGDARATHERTAGK